jgi:hypothetical protein
MRFDGSDYDPATDDARLTTQYARVFAVMERGEWLTLAELERLTHDPAASISAQLRHMRKERFGAHVIEKRHRGEPAAGLWEYRLAPSDTLF